VSVHAVSPAAKGRPASLARLVTGVGITISAGIATAALSHLSGGFNPMATVRVPLKAAGNAPNCMGCASGIMPGRSGLAQQNCQCSLDGCDNPYYGDGLCRKHYDLRRGPRPGQRDPERARHTAKRRRARLAGARGRHSEVEWIAKLAEFGGRCAYCDAVAEAKDHVVPLRRGGTDDIDNIVPACHPCNSSKHTQTLAEWYGFVEPERAAPRMRGSWSNEDRCA
jgi:5-methylcytosine-specific restriction endonuclease McrA